MKNLPFLFLLLTYSLLSYSQCGNTDFELGNFTGWAGRWGSCCPITLPTAGLGGTRQVIMTQGIDPHSCGGLRTVYQGTYSARLGNDRVGAQAEGLSYTFVVSTSTTIIRYAYAVVFQDPNHLPSEQPRFQSRVRLANGSVIPCTDYMVTASSGLPGFQYCAPTPPDTTVVAWKDWTEVAVDLSAYVGQTVSLEFETGDCQRRGHYGYAYIDAIQCGQAANHITVCQNDTTLSVSAVGGFASYTWETGDTTQAVTVNPQLYDTLTCTVTTFGGCELTLYYIVDVAPGSPSFIYTASCNGSVQFTSTSSATYSPILYTWTFPDGTGSTAQNPVHVFLPGTYQVGLQVGSVLGCSHDTIQSITVPASPIPAFTVDSVCLGQLVQLVNLTTSPDGSQLVYSWSFGDSTWSTLANPTHLYQGVATYSIELTATAISSGCSAVAQGQVTIYPIPTIPQNGILHD